MENMKTYNHLFEKVICIENLYEAYKNARRGKRFKPAVLAATWDIEKTIHQLHEDLKNETWEPDPYREFLCESEVKRRIIHAPSFRDRILHHAIIQIVQPLFEKKFIYDTYAVMPGRGTHRAVFRVQEFLRRAAATGEQVYVLQCDISKYYPSMRHDVLTEQIARTIRDKKLLRLWAKLIDGFQPETGVGLPIGALTSQLSANIYLNALDHFVKECIGFKKYVRFMDDFILISTDKAELKSALADIKWLLDTHLRLRLNPKTRIYAASQGVDFAGYRIWWSHIRPRKRNIKAAKIRFKNLSHQYKYGRTNLDDIQARVSSFLGYVKHCDARKTTESTLKWLQIQPKGE